MMALGAVAAVLVCGVAVAAGDRPLRRGAGLTLGAWTLGVALQLTWRDPHALLVADLAYIVSLAVLMLLSPLRIWLLAAFVTELLMIALELNAVEIDGRHFHGFATEYDVLNGLLLAAIAGGVLARNARLIRRRPTPASLAPQRLA